jgi:glycerol-3-phosphate dehydrogenase
MINEKKVITIIGAGNVGTAMTAILSQNKII